MAPPTTTSTSKLPPIGYFKLTVCKYSANHPKINTPAPQKCGNLPGDRSKLSLQTRDESIQANIGNTDYDADAETLSGNETISDIETLSAKSLTSSKEREEDQVYEAAMILFKMAHSKK
ncbi:hypothetical protein E8E13_010228 [Curvularia kusanoi]|uniref:Uncharacterized protein n=1 Tax=Curvularia kusanoi TaxID=90978 RepID=A0A9P4TJJ0_CURKU|nr:hypothetical protein E8E13_010228 [Curvularia kusanoi]